MSSLNISSKPLQPKTKIFVVCGTDVSGQKRTKDRLGRYYCNPCLDRLSAERSAAAAAREQIDNEDPPADNEHLFCEQCGVHATRDQLQICEDAVLCGRCANSLNSAAEVAPDTGSGDFDVQQYVRTTNWLLVLAIFTGIFVFPVGVVVQVLCMRRLLRLADRPAHWGWMIAAALPLVGLIPVKLMADRAGKVVHKPLSSIKPLDRDQRRKFRQLIVLQNAGWSLAVIPWVASWITYGGFFVTEFWVAMFLAMDAVSISLSVYARVRAYPYRKALREAGGQRIWFSDSSDVARDWASQQLLTTPARSGRA